MSVKPGVMSQAPQKSKSKKEQSKTDALRKDIDHVAHTWDEEKV